MQAAYSYLRFSTPKQARTSNVRTQLNQARKYAEANGLALDEDLSFQDLGISAYRGANSRIGKLGDFLLAVRHGLVERESYLLVESLDRLSRDTARKALRTLGNICDEGITVVTLIDDQKYTAEILDRDPIALIVSIVIFMRSNDESFTKSRRLKQARKSKIELISEGTKTRLGGSKPGWLKIENDKFVFEKEKAKSVKMAFYLAELGIGTTIIAKTLNLNHMPTLGTSNFWNATKVNELLRNLTVTGTLIPSSCEIIDGRRVIVAFDPLRGYYPRLISQKTWNKTHSHIENRRKNSAAANTGVRIGDLQNIFAYASQCPLCGNAMIFQRLRYRKNGVGIDKRRLVCALAKNGGKCTTFLVGYKPIETAFIKKGPDMMRHHLSSRSIEDLAGKDRFSQYEFRLLEPRLSNIIKVMCDIGNNRQQFNLQFRRIFQSVVINYPKGSLDFKWVYGGQTSMPVANIGDPQTDLISTQVNPETS